MKKIILLLLLSVTFFSCSSYSDGEPIVPETNSLVKKIITENNVVSIYYDNDKIDYYESIDGQDVYKKVFIYENGLIVKTEDYLNDVRNESADNFYIYENGRIIESSGLEGGINFTHKYEYNSLGQIISDTQFNDDVYCCESNYFYDSNGNLNSENSDYIYDNNKNPEYYIFSSAYSNIKTTSKNNLLSGGNETFQYEFNSDGLVTKRITLEDGIISETKIYEY